MLRLVIFGILGLLLVIPNVNATVPVKNAYTNVPVNVCVPSDPNSNCGGGGGGSGTVSSGTVNQVSKYTATTTVGNSNITSTSTSVGINNTSPDGVGYLSVQGAPTINPVFDVRFTGDSYALMTVYSPTGNFGDGGCSETAEYDIPDVNHFFQVTSCGNMIILSTDPLYVESPGNSTYLGDGLGRGNNNYLQVDDSGSTFSWNSSAGTNEMIIDENGNITTQGGIHSGNPSFNINIGGYIDELNGDTNVLIDDNTVSLYNNGGQVELDNGGTSSNSAMLFVGGDAANSHINFRSTNASGTTSDYIAFQLGNNGATIGMTITDNNGSVIYNLPSLTASELVGTDSSKNLVSLTALPNGTTATTQAIGDNTTKVATDAFVQNQINAQVEMHAEVQAATTTTLLFSPTYSNGSSGVGATLSGTAGVLVIDGYTPSLNDRLLIKNQSSVFQNGCYTVTTLGTITIGYVLTRCIDFNQNANINYGDTFPVLQGSTNANQQFTMNNNTSITVGTTSITFAQTSGGSQLVQGTGISISGNTIALSTPVAVANGGTGVTSSTGTGNVVLSSSPTLVTPALGTPSSATLTNATGLPAAGVVTSQVTTTQTATPTIAAVNNTIYKITGLAQAITSMTTNFTLPANDGDIIEIRITDNATARAITWGSDFESTTVTLPSTTVISTEIKVFLQYNSTASKMDCIGVA